MATVNILSAGSFVLQHKHCLRVKRNLVVSVSAPASPERPLPGVGSKRERLVYPEPMPPRLARVLSAPVGPNFESPKRVRTACVSPASGRTTLSPPVSPEKLGIRPPEFTMRYDDFMKDLGSRVDLAPLSPGPTSPGAELEQERGLRVAVSKLRESMGMSRLVRCDAAINALLDEYPVVDIVKEILRCHKGTANTRVFAAFREMARMRGDAASEAAFRDAAQHELRNEAPARVGLIYKRCAKVVGEGYHEFGWSDHVRLFAEEAARCPDLGYGRLMRAAGFVLVRAARLVLTDYRKRVGPDVMQHVRTSVCRVMDHDEIHYVRGLTLAAHRLLHDYFAVVVGDTVDLAVDPYGVLAAVRAQTCDAVLGMYTPKQVLMASPASFHKVYIYNMAGEVFDTARRNGDTRLYEILRKMVHDCRRRSLEMTRVLGSVRGMSRFSQQVGLRGDERKPLDGPAIRLHSMLEEPKA